MSLEFVPSPRRTLGIEIELGIIDAASGDLVPASNGLLAAVVPPDQAEHPTIKHELFQSTVEIITGISENSAEAHADLSASVAEVMAYLSPRGWTLMGGGVHPLADPKTLLRSPSERYDRLVERIQWPARRLQIHGTHFHVGVPDKESAISIMNYLLDYLPHFVALSASSPYWEREDTGLASVRSKIFEAMPTAGLPSFFRDWQHFDQFTDAMIASGSIDSVREIWWDLRPHVDFGTIEFRMCDSIATLQETAALGALAQCLVEWLYRRLQSGQRPAEPVGWVVRENKWRAARWGVDADLVDIHGNTRPLRAEIQSLITELTPIAQEFGSSAELANLATILAGGNSSVRQRRVVEAGGSLHDVVQQLATEFATDQPS